MCIGLGRSLCYYSTKLNACKSIDYETIYRASERGIHIYLPRYAALIEKWKKNQRPSAHEESVEVTRSTICEVGYSSGVSYGLVILR